MRTEKHGAIDALENRAAKLRVMIQELRDFTNGAAGVEAQAHVHKTISEESLYDLGTELQEVEQGLEVLRQAELIRPIIFEEYQTAAFISRFEKENRRDKKVESALPY